MDTRFFDLEDSADEIYDIEDLQEDGDEEQSFTQMLNSNYTFWWHLILTLSLAMLSPSLVLLVFFQRVLSFSLLSAATTVLLYASDTHTP